MSKTHYIGTISDRDLKKKIRQPLPPPPQRHESDKSYRRHPKHKKEKE